MNSIKQYHGRLKAGRKHGYGCCQWSSGAKYMGQWQDDQRHGSGTYIWPDGSKYVGQWLDDQMHGQGILYNADGTIRSQGNWVHGQYQCATPPSEPGTLHSALAADIQALWRYEWSDDHEKDFSALLARAAHHMQITYLEPESELAATRHLSLCHQALVQRYGKYRAWPVSALEAFRIALVARLKSVLPTEWAARLPDRKTATMRLTDLYHSIEENFTSRRYSYLVSRYTPSLPLLRTIRWNTTAEQQKWLQVLSWYYQACYHSLSPHDQQLRWQVLRALLEELIPLGNGLDTRELGNQVVRLVEPYWLGHMPRTTLQYNPFIVFEQAEQSNNYVPAAVYYTGLFWAFQAAGAPSEYRMRYLVGNLAAACLQAVVVPAVCCHLLAANEAVAQQLKECGGHSVMIPEIQNWLVNLLQRQVRFLMEHQQWQLAVAYLNKICQVRPGKVEFQKALTTCQQALSCSECQ